jgi:hypothetical protein
MDAPIDIQAVAAEAFATLDTGGQSNHSPLGLLLLISTMHTV